MAHLFGDSLSGGTLILLTLALGLALSFEFVNGFHDTANAVATVIYTKTLPPWFAVIWSGLWNLTGVMLSAGTVAFGILALLPVELVLHVGSGAGFAMVFSLLISAIIWNAGTWYLGLPASSSHTLIGSIVGVGLANSVLSQGHTFGDGVNWGKVQDTLSALVASPLIGFAASALLLLAMKALVRVPALYKAPEGDAPPPWWVRAVLVLTCTGVSFAHGSNDGQKGMGLILLILIGVVPSAYAINLGLDGKSIATIAQVSVPAQKTLDTLAGVDPVSSDVAVDNLSGFIKANGTMNAQTFASLDRASRDLMEQLSGKTSLSQIPKDQRATFRSSVYLVSAAISKLAKKKAIPAEDVAPLTAYQKALDPITKFIPTWVKIAVALCLGLGTMVGWKRIVVTVGERIGKSHLTYGQGAAAELVAMGTIQAADMFGLPVSTTHILSSGVAGTMAANQSGLQAGTLRNILLAWVLTLPVSVFLGSLLFAGSLRLVAAFTGH